MTIKEFFSFKANRFFWVNIIAMVVVAVLIVFGALKGLDIYTRHGQAVVAVSYTHLMLPTKQGV